MNMGRQAAEKTYIHGREPAKIDLRIIL